MRRLSLWMRAHPIAGDSLIAVVVLLIDLAAYFADVAAAKYSDVHRAIQPADFTVPMAVLMALPLVFRRRNPLWAAYAVLALSVPHGVLQFGPGDVIAAGIMQYSLTVYTSRKKAVCYLAAVFGIAVAWLALAPQRDTLASLLFVAVELGFSWLFGEFVGARQAYRTELEARLHLLETERDHASRIAVAEERGRIARELHDVVAHAVSVIVVQADGASYAVRSNPELAERAVHTISRTGREALAELRRLLEVLRGENSDGPRVPQPDAASLTELAERVQQAGIPVALDIDGPLTGLPAGVSLGVYRIVQESLTNTLKHAGTGARAEVRVRRTEDLVEVEVLDDGAGRAPVLSRGATPGPRQGASPQTPSLATSARLPGGNGVIGMRERANLFGGSIEVGPRPGGGWRVHARLPARLAP